MSTVKVDTIQNRLGTKSVPVDTVVDGSAKAWVNFNGTGVVAIRAAFNVGSITDNGLGDWTVNFTAPMADANYVLVLGGGDAGAGFIPFTRYATTAPTVSAARIGLSSSAFGSADSTYVQLAVLR